MLGINIKVPNQVKCQIKQFHVRTEIKIPSYLSKVLIDKITNAMIVPERSVPSLGHPNCVLIRSVHIARNATVMTCQLYLQELYITGILRHTRCAKRQKLF